MTLQVKGYLTVTASWVWWHCTTKEPRTRTLNSELLLKYLTKRLKDISTGTHSSKNNTMIEKKSINISYTRNKYIFLIWPIAYWFTLHCRLSKWWIIIYFDLKLKSMKQKTSCQPLCVHSVLTLFCHHHAPSLLPSYLIFISRYVLMNAGEPLNEIEAEQMMKEADKDGDGTIDYEGLDV